jgi:hypothetical protein
MSSSFKWAEGGGGGLKWRRQNRVYSMPHVVDLVKVKCKVAATICTKEDSSRLRTASGWYCTVAFGNRKLGIEYYCSEMEFEPQNSYKSHWSRSGYWTFEVGREREVRKNSRIVGERESRGRTERYLWGEKGHHFVRRWIGFAALFFLIRAVRVRCTVYCTMK